MIRQAVEGPALSGSSKAWVTKFYTDRAFQPAFTSRGQLTYAAEQLRNSMITDIPSHGLILADYLTPAIQSYFAAPLLEGAWLRAEIDLAKAFVDASIHMSIGRLDLKSLANSGTPQTKTRFKDVKFERRAFTKWADLQSAVGAEGFQSVWNRIAPQHKIYSNLKSILASLRAVQAAGGFKAISPTSATLRVGSSHAVVAQLKARAKALGYFVTVLDNRFDQELSDIVRDIQKSNLASPTGYLSPGDKSGWEAFGVTSERRINQVELNMEKVRWLPEALEERHIFVNLAIQELTVVDPGLMNPLLKDMPVIVGQPLRKTPSMRDMVTDVVLNPTWTVPTTVFVEDKVPQIREIIATQGLLGVNTYFFDHQFSVKSGDLKETLSPDSIDWINIDPRNTDIYVVQA
ncbi:MAG: L,D-transpeptidase family protein, partial [Bdellovibrionota bacterium]